MSLEGKVAVITGATGKLGGVVTKRFLSEGARVAMVYHNQDELEALLPELAAEAEALPLRCNVTAEAEVQRTMAEAHERLGGPQVLLNLAGGYAAGEEVAETEEATWDRMMDLNLRSIFLCCKHALRYMLPQGYGRIVNVSSKVAVDLPAGKAAYAVSKAGVVSFTKCLAQEVKGTGVSAAAIMPSIIDTPVTRAARPKADYSKWVRPEQIAEVLVYLASEAGGALNGSILPLFGAV